MTASPNEFRLLHRLELAPSMVSLGIEARLFKDGAGGDAAGFDAAMSGPNDTLWLFRGEDFLGYDLRRDEVSHPPSPIGAGWAGGGLPPAFKVGLDSAVWAGPSYPRLAYLFRDGEFLRLDCQPDPTDPSKWSITLAPHSTASEWLRLPSPDGVPRRGATLEPCAKLYGLRDAADRVHFFTRDGRYARHNLNNGEYDIAPCETVSRFPLPPHFAGRVDLAFYGAGTEAEHIFFFCRDMYAQLDLRRGTIVRSGAIEQRFPALGAMLTRPQLYLVEEHVLDTYVGPLSLGRLVSTLQVPPESRRTSVVETRVVTPAALALRQNLVEQNSAEAVADFYERLGRIQSSGAFPGASTGVAIWGGEVDALGGGPSLENQRAMFLKATFAAIGEQMRQSTHVVERQVVDITAPPFAAGGEVLNRETFELANTGNATRQIEFMELVQQFLTLAVMRNVRLAYSNGRDGPKPFSLREVDAQLRELLVNQEQASAVIAFLKDELARIQNSSGEMQSFLLDGADLQVDARVQSLFVVEGATSQPQIIRTPGIIQSSHLWHQPTYQTRAVDITAIPGEATTIDLSAHLPMAIAPVMEVPSALRPPDVA